MEWQHYRYKQGHRYADCGTGILTGDVIAVDIDIRDAKLSEQMRDLAIDRFGKAPERVGLAPKVALIYRVEGEPFKKIHTRDYTLAGDKPGDKPHKVEILADGQQIVCYHIHPETGKPYRWNGAGEPTKTPVSKLSGVTRQQCEEYVAECEALLAKTGTPCGKLKGAAGAEATGAGANARDDQEALRASDPALLREALACIPNADEDYDKWIAMCLAIKGALGRSGYDEWMQWSSLSSKHDTAISEKAWKTAKPDRIGAGTIFKLAQDHGWKFPRGKSRAHAIELRAGEAARELAELAAAMPAVCEAEQLMVYGGQLTHPYMVERPGFRGRTVQVLALNVLSPRALASHIDSQIGFTQWKVYKDGPRPVTADCPDKLVQTLLDRSDLIAKIPVQVRGISATPVWRDGELVSASGYDHDSRMWITAPNIALPKPTRRAVAEALTYLQDEWLSEFRFADDRSAAAAVGLLVSAAMRSSLPHCPMFVVNKHEHGEGGSTLCTLAAVVQTGRPPAVITVNAEDGNAEIEKRIDSTQLAGEMTICLDNWKSGGVVNLTSLATIVSEPERKVRYLGLSKNVTCPNSQLVLVNGRNIGVTDDFIRRTVEIALDTRMARPERRRFKRPNLIADAVAERAEILTACYTIVASGARAQVKTRAGFSEWTRLVAEPLAALGLPDISVVPEELRQADTELALLAQLLPEWKRLCERVEEPRGVTVSDVIGNARWDTAAKKVRGILGEATGAKTFQGEPQLNAWKVGYFLRRIAGRRIDKLRLVSPGTTRNGVARWRIEELE